MALFIFHEMKLFLKKLLQGKNQDGILLFVAAKQQRG
ncbi:hypothetical protein BPUM_0067 [Bacillus pumilus SAFR-032]|uniref:Uncharacterized protein n=1 Tax=Bacillus pumilus (strain SAFR-032) TaxID=315750 RepID=A8F950_BACP2|nr:hypothetical protein BPUM_0067 [Bacillus pumilus SAFR-032]